MNLEAADRLQHLKERVNWILMGKQGARMNTYRFSVQQIIIQKLVQSYKQQLYQSYNQVHGVSLHSY